MSAERLPKVFVARTLLGDALERLQAVAEVSVWPEPRPPTASEFLSAAAGADAILTMVTDRVGKGVAFMPFHFSGWFQGFDQVICR